LGLTLDKKKIHHICTCGKVLGVDDWRMEDRIGPFSVTTRVSMSGFTRYDVEDGDSPENMNWYETEIIIMIQYLSQKPRVWIQSAIL
jgi:hypothetical protein